MVLIMLGAPGTGKGTQGKLLSAHFQIPNISTGDILRAAIERKTELGEKAKAYIDKGELVPDDVMIGLVQHRLKEDDCKNGFILDGFPRTVKQAEALESFLAQQGITLDHVICLELEPKKIIERLTSRRVCRICGKDYNILSEPIPKDNKCIICGGDIIRRSDDTEETVKKRLQVYQEKTKPLREYFQKKGKLKIFNADGTIAEIQRKIVDFLSKKDK